MPLDHPTPPAPALHIPFDNTYAALPPRFFAPVDLSPVAAPRLIRVNRALAEHLGIDPDALAGPDGVQVLAGNQVPQGAAPIALAYAGHQFGNFTPQLGDGRAMLLGEVVARDGRRYDIQLKGSGPTPFSRRGDGRAAVGPVLREYLVAEAMAALGIPTSRALAAVATGEPVYRETTQPGAVLARVASSHIRVGTFQFFAARNDVDALRTLADTAIARHDPDLLGHAAPYPAFLRAAVVRQAELVAAWLHVGFIHGVMNTDNTAVSGETIDYGPCAFMDAYDPGTVFSSIDHAGRYAYANQPRIAAWNMTRLAEALLPLLAPRQDDAIPVAEDALAAFAPAFEAAHRQGMRRKAGLDGAEPGCEPGGEAGDDAMVQDLLHRMAESAADFTLTFRALAAAAEDPAQDAAVRTLFQDPAAYDAWSPAWHARLAQAPRPAADTAAAMRAVNPAYIPRNHQVEAAIQAAVAHGDHAPFETLLAAVTRPFEEREGLERFILPPQPEERVLHTFCGT